MSSSLRVVVGLSVFACAAEVACGSNEVVSPNVLSPTADGGTDGGASIADAGADTAKVGSDGGVQDAAPDAPADAGPKFNDLVKGYVETACSFDVAPPNNPNVLDLYDMVLDHDGTALFIYSSFPQGGRGLTRYIVQGGAGSCQLVRDTAFGLQTIAGGTSFFAGRAGEAWGSDVTQGQGYPIRFAPSAQQCTDPNGIGESNFIEAIATTSTTMGAIGGAPFATLFQVSLYDRTGASCTLSTFRSIAIPAPYKFENAGLTTSVAFIYGDAIVAGKTIGRLMGFNRATGALLWERDANSLPSVSPYNALGSSPLMRNSDSFAWLATGDEFLLRLAEDGSVLNSAELPSLSGTYALAPAADGASAYVLRRGPVRITRVVAK